MRYQGSHHLLFVDKLSIRQAQAPASSFMEPTGQLPKNKTVILKANCPHGNISLRAIWHLMSRCSKTVLRERKKSVAGKQLHDVLKHCKFCAQRSMLSSSRKLRAGCCLLTSQFCAGSKTSPTQGSMSHNSLVGTFWHV